MLKRGWVLLLTLTLTLVAVILSSGVDGYQPGSIVHGSSRNWAGYVVDAPLPQAVSQIQAQWAVPEVRCTTANTFSSVWVGVDGSLNHTVEQIGTEQDCWHGYPIYYAWYELYPADQVFIDLSIKPGDLISAQVWFLGLGRLMLSLADPAVSYIPFTRILPYQADRTSAEWVAEAPALRHGPVLPLADFGSVTMTGGVAMINDQQGSIAHWQAEPMVMARRSRILAQPGQLSADGNGFSVTWRGSQ